MHSPRYASRYALSLVAFHEHAQLFRATELALLLTILEVYEGVRRITRTFRKATRCSRGRRVEGWWARVRPGLSCALSAPLEGLSVLVNEKCKRISGTTAVSGGLAWSPDSHLPLST